MRPAELARPKPPFGGRIVQRALERAGFDVLVAGPGEETLEVLCRTNPALVITDLAMPRRTGVELARRIRAETPGVRVMAPSGDRTLLHLARAEGLTSLAKPVGQPDIVREATSLLAAV